MTAENIGAEVRRDTMLEQMMLEAVIADRNAQPRNQQIQVGPSSLGGCRELLRAGLFEPESLAEPETYWATAAHVGSIMGDDLERIFGERLGALTQQRITTALLELGVNVSGAIDLLFASENFVSMIGDLKSTADMGSVLYDLKSNATTIETLLAIWREGQLFDKVIETPDGGYELTDVMITKLAKLHYYVQVATYVTGAIQAGLLPADAEGRLVFYDRSGVYQEFVALVITAEEIAMFFEIGQRRIDQVVRAQEAYEGAGGNPAVIAHLRDMTPSYCFSEKVQCPRRMHCWAGSDWAADNRITAADHISAVDRYEAGRQMAKLADGMKRSAREELKGVQGVLPDGRMVTWVKGGSTINVVTTTRTTIKPVAEVLDDALAKIEAEPEGKPVAAEDLRAARRTELRRMRKPELTLIATDDQHQLDAKGLKDEIIERILDAEFGTERAEIVMPRVETEGGEVLANADAAPDAGTLVVPDALAQDWVGEPRASTSAEKITGIWPGDYRVGCPTCGDLEFFDAGDDTFQCLGCGNRVDGSGELIEPPMPEGEPIPDEEKPGAGILASDEEMEQFVEQVEERIAEVKQVAQRYEEADVLRYRQELFGMTHADLVGTAEVWEVATDVPRNFMIQALIDKRFPPVAGRGWRPGETTGDPRTDRLRQMQYDADPAMRRNIEKEQQ